MRLRIFHVCHNENFRNSYLSFYWKKWFYIWYMALAWWLVISSSRSWDICYESVNGRTRWLQYSPHSRYNKLFQQKGGLVWCMWVYTSCLQCDLEFFMFAIMKTFVTVIAASTGRNDFIFDIWLWHGDLYRVSPFQLYRTWKLWKP
jgi:hypothetical protein